MRATARVVPPHLYKLVWSIAIHGPLTSAELADDHNRPVDVKGWDQWTPQQVSNRLRTVQRLGLLERDHRGFWSLTDEGRKWITTGAGV